MDLTTNYKLKKPGASDYYSIDDFNDNADAVDAALIAIDTALAGKAPAGYGLGSKIGMLITDGNDALSGGWYYWGNVKTNLPFTYGHMRVDPRLVGSGGLQSLMQTAYSESHLGCVAQRKLADSNFGEWEWVNPPMVIGVEYRTTERYLGKPVYAQVVKFGALPDTTTKFIAHEISDINYIVGLWGVTSDRSMLTGNPRINYFHANANNILITTNTSWDTTAYVTMKYTKTTD